MWATLHFDPNEAPESGIHQQHASWICEAELQDSKYIPPVPGQLHDVTCECSSTIWERI